MTALDATTVDGLQLRRIMGRRAWQPPQRFGPDGWLMDGYDGRSRIIVTTGPATAPGDVDQSEWTHASISHVDELPTYDELKQLHRAVWGAPGWAYQVFAPASHHVNIHEYALHLWGRPDGRAVLPEFGAGGSI